MAQLAVQGMENWIVADLELTRQEDLAQQERSEVAALAEYNISITNFYAAMGTLLERNGVRFVVPDAPDSFTSGGELRDVVEGLEHQQGVLEFAGSRGAVLLVGQQRHEGLDAEAVLDGGGEGFLDQEEEAAAGRALELRRHQPAVVERQTGGHGIFRRRQAVPASCPRRRGSCTC